jgi:hypothetical protein
MKGGGFRTGSDRSPVPGRGNREVSEEIPEIINFNGISNYGMIQKT